MAFAEVPKIPDSLATLLAFASRTLVIKGVTMTIVLIILTSLLGAVATASALGKLTKKPDIMASMEHVGVKPDMIPVLALLEIFGAIGLLAGIWNKPLGVSAAIGLTLYFDGALISHLRVKDKVKDFAPAMVLGWLALAVAILEITAR